MPYFPEFWTATLLAILAASSPPADTAWKANGARLERQAEGQPEDALAMIQISCPEGRIRLGVTFPKSLIGEGRPWFYFEIDHKKGTLLKAVVSGAEVILDPASSTAVLSSMLTAESITVAVWFGLSPSGDATTFRLNGLVDALKPPFKGRCEAPKESPVGRL
jgi:hypothetical protein